MSEASHGAPAGDTARGASERGTMQRRETRLTSVQVLPGPGIVVSAAPGFYNHPQTLDDLVDFVVGKVLDVMNVGHELVERWGHKRRS